VFCPVLKFREEKRTFTKVAEVTWTFFFFWKLYIMGCGPHGPKKEKDSTGGDFGALLPTRRSPNERSPSIFGSKDWRSGAPALPQWALVSVTELHYTWAGLNAIKPTVIYSGRPDYQ
jgi:hypothetical protein